MRIHRKHHCRRTVAVLLAGCLLAGGMGVRAEQPGPQPEGEFKMHLDAALKGDAEAQFRVGEMYEQGVGTARDPSLAFLWYKKAEIQGHARARERTAKWENAAGVNREEARVNTTLRALQQTEQQDDAKTRLKEKTSSVPPPRTRKNPAPAAKAAATALAKNSPPKASGEIAAPEEPARAAAPPAVELPPVIAPADAAAPPAVKPAPPAPSVAAAPQTAPAPLAPAKVPEKPKGPPKTEFTANPCKGPQARFLSTCR